MQAVTSTERLRRMLAGKAPDRRPFVPSVYEHGAAVIGSKPCEAARDPHLMSEAALMGFLLEAGTSLVVADYNTDFRLVRARTDGRGILVRGCVDPKCIERGDWRQVSRAVEALARKADGMSTFIWGCGCVSYSTPPQQVLRFKRMCLAAPRPGAEAD